MIKLFRKIRKQLVTENKFSKYLIYAFGEISIIIIGIFIALQIQNWNEKQKQNIEFEIVLEQLYNAVKYDTEFFNSRENIITKQIQLIDVFLETPDSIQNDTLPYAISFLAYDDLNSFTSETNYHISNLKYNINNPKQNELSKQITSYVSSINIKTDFGQVERFSPLFYNLEIPELIVDFFDIKGNSKNNNYYSKTDYEKLHNLVRSSNFKAILKTHKLLSQAFA